MALDLKKGGEVAQRLESLYQFMLNQLTRANIKADRKALETVIKILSPLGEAWEQLFHASTNAGQGGYQPPKNIESKC